MKKVLMVEDGDVYHAMAEKIFAGKVEFMQAKTRMEGWELFQKNPDIDLIIMDACVPGDKPNTMPLVEKIMESGYDKPIIASSGWSDYRRKLMAVGATHEVEDKRDAPVLALKLLCL